MFDKGFQLNRNTKTEQQLLNALKFNAINVLLLNNAQLNIENIFWKAICLEKVATVELCIEKGIDVKCFKWKRRNLGFIISY